MRREEWMQPDFHGRVLIAGFGVDAGASAARFFLERKCAVTIYDAKPETDFQPEEIAELKNRGVAFQLGVPEPTGDFDLVIRTPGIVGRAPSMAAIRRYEGSGVPVSSATNIFFALCPGKVIGVTGTKGKGTTASLIYEIVKTAGKEAVLGGNIGSPMLDMLPTIGPDTITILELSSFQLVDAVRSPQVAVVLMITEDHLDLHKNREEYVRAKMNIVRHQTEKDIAVYNVDYPDSVWIGEMGKGTAFAVSGRRALEHDGCFVRGDEIVIREHGSEEVVAHFEDVQIPGRHNLENVCAAAMAARGLGIANEFIREGIRRFRGLEHRLELVREVNGVKYYNDSFATNPSSTIAAIEAFDAPEVLILGGSPKGSDFSELARVITERKNIRAIIGVGVEWGRIKAALLAVGAKVACIEGLTTMKDIVEAARATAKAGDVVLLSPACASFGMFQDYKDRGKQFKEMVNELL